MCSAVAASLQAAPADVPVERTPQVSLSQLGRGFDDSGDRTAIVGTDAVSGDSITEPTLPGGAAKPPPARPRGPASAARVQPAASGGQAEHDGDDNSAPPSIAGSRPGTAAALEAEAEAALRAASWSAPLLTVSLQRVAADGAEGAPCQEAESAAAANTGPAADQVAVAAAAEEADSGEPSGHADTAGIAAELYGSASVMGDAYNEPPGLPEGLAVEASALSDVGLAEEPTAAAGSAPGDSSGTGAAVTCDLGNATGVDPPQAAAEGPEVKWDPSAATPRPGPGCRSRSRSRSRSATTSRKRVSVRLQLSGAASPDPDKDPGPGPGSASPATSCRSVGSVGSRRGGAGSARGRAGLGLEPAAHLDESPSDGLLPSLNGPAPAPALDAEVSQHLDAALWGGHPGLAAPPPPQPARSMRTSRSFVAPAGLAREDQCARSLRHAGAPAPAASPHGHGPGGGGSTGGGGAEGPVAGPPAAVDVAAPAAAPEAAAFVSLWEGPAASDILLQHAVAAARKRAAAERRRRSSTNTGGGGEGGGGSECAAQDCVGGDTAGAAAGAGSAGKHHMSAKEKHRAAAVLFQREAEVWARTHGQFPPARRLAPGITKMVSQWFALVDGDSSGALAAKELAAALQAAGVPCGESDLRELVTMIDRNHDGCVSWAEFQAFLLQEFAAGKALADGEYVLPSGKRLAFGAMIARLKRVKLLEEVMRGGSSRARYVDLLYNREALCAETGMSEAAAAALQAEVLGPLPGAEGPMAAALRRCRTHRSRASSTGWPDPLEGTGGGKRASGGSGTGEGGEGAEGCEEASPRMPLGSGGASFYASRGRAGAAALRQGTLHGSGHVPPPGGEVEEGEVETEVFRLTEVALPAETAAEDSPDACPLSPAGLPALPPPPALRRPDTRVFRRALEGARRSAPEYVMQRFGMPNPCQAAAAAAAPGPLWAASPQRGSATGLAGIAAADVAADVAEAGAPSREASAPGLAPCASAASAPPGPRLRACPLAASLYGAGHSRYRRWSTLGIDPAAEDPDLWQAKAAALLMMRTRRTLAAVRVGGWEAGAAGGRLASSSSEAGLAATQPHPKRPTLHTHLAATWGPGSVRPQPQPQRPAGHPPPPPLLQLPSLPSPSAAGLSRIPSQAPSGAAPQPPPGLGDAAAAPVAAAHPAGLPPPQPGPMSPRPRHQARPAGGPAGQRRAGPAASPSFGGAAGPRRGQQARRGGAAGGGDGGGACGCAEESDPDPDPDPCAAAVLRGLVPGACGPGPAAARRKRQAAAAAAARAARREESRAPAAPPGPRLPTLQACGIGRSPPPQGH